MGGMSAPDSRWSAQPGLWTQDGGQQNDRVKAQRAEQCPNRVMNTCRTGLRHHNRGVPIDHHRLSDTTEAPDRPQERFAEVSCRLRTGRAPPREQPNTVEWSPTHAPSGWFHHAREPTSAAATSRTELFPQADTWFADTLAGLSSEDAPGPDSPSGS